jgi:beta-alanine degradation protein BauB
MHRSSLALITFVSCLLAACGSAAKPAPAAAATSGSEQPAPAESEAAAGPVAAGVTDPAKASPDVYKVVLDGPRMRVLLATWQPGQRDNLHGHPTLAAYALTDVFGIGNDADDTQVSIRVKKGQALLQAPVKAHAFENRGKSEAKLVIFEIKDGQPSTALPKNAKEAQSASPDVYELVTFDEHVHVLRATWKPGQSDEFHGHSAMTLYALTDVEGTITDEKDKTSPFSMKAGTARFEEAVKEHSFQNTGSAPAQLLMIETRD